jgi:hypothetical protein
MADAAARIEACRLGAAVINGQCGFYMRGWECVGRCRGGAHLPKDQRPACQLYTAHDTCMQGEACWFPHTLQAKRHTAQVALQTLANRTERVAAFLADTYGSTLRGVVECRAHGFNRSRERILLVDVDSSVLSPAGLVASLCANPISASGLTRTYLVDKCLASEAEVAAHVRERALGIGAASAAARALNAAAPGAPTSAVPELRFRLHAYPPSLTTSLTARLQKQHQQLQAAVPPAPAAAVDATGGEPGDDLFTMAPHSRDFDVFINALWVDGAYYVSVRPRAAGSGAALPCAA